MMQTLTFNAKANGRNFYIANVRITLIAGGMDAEKYNVMHICGYIS